MHCAQVERASEEDERINDRIATNSASTSSNVEKSESQMSKSEIVDNSETQTGACKAASHEKLSVKQKLKTASSQKRKETDDLEIVIKTEEEEEENRDSDMDRMTEDGAKVKAGLKRKKEGRRRKKMKARQPEMKDLMVGRRMASLNASAMMQVNILQPYIWGNSPISWRCQERCYDRPEIFLELPSFTNFR